MIDINQDYTLVIANKNYSSWSMRPWVVLKHFAINFSEHKILLRMPDTKQKLIQYSTNKKVPCLIVNNNSSQEMLAISDSLAICEYLAEVNLDKNLWPAQVNQRAIARSIVCEMHSGFAALRSSYNMNIKREPQNHDKNIRANNSALDDDIKRIEQIWTKCLQDSDGEYLFGEFSIADAFFAPVAMRFNGYDVEINDICRNYIKSITNTPACAEWIKEAKEEIEIIPDYEV